MYLLVLQKLPKRRTEIYNAQRAIVRLIKPFVLRIFPPGIHLKLPSVHFSLQCSNRGKFCFVHPRKFLETLNGIFGSDRSQQYVTFAHRLYFHLTSILAHFGQLPEMLAGPRTGESLKVNVCVKYKKIFVFLF